MPSPRSRVGRSAEIVAAAELGRRGYVILASNYRTRRGEIDFIARDGDTLVFVEVRSKSGPFFGTPAESITASKILHIVAVASDYIDEHSLHDTACRFDVVEVVRDEARRLVVGSIIRDAFTA